LSNEAADDQAFVAQALLGKSDREWWCSRHECRLRSPGVRHLARLSTLATTMSRWRF
jgi:hypothetical protein